MPTVASPRRRAGIRLCTSLAVAALGLSGLVACAPSPTPSAAPTSPAASPEPTRIPTDEPTAEPAPAGIRLPVDCAGIYSPTMLDALTRDAPPLNDPGVTLLSTEIAAGLDVLDGAETIRCSWGPPSEFGLATNVTIVDEAQAATLAAALLDAGMECTDQAGGRLCRVQREYLQDDDVVAVTGETHFLRENGWVSTHWIDFAPEAYTEDIIATLWG